MTKEEFEKAKAEIIAKHGKPETDGMHGPANECARLLVALRQERRLSQMAENRRAAKEAGQKQAPETLKDIAESITEEQKKKIEGVTPPPLLLGQEDLKLFDTVEQEIVRLRFEQWIEDTKLIGNKVGWSRQRVASFLKEGRVTNLAAKFFDQTMPFQSRKSLAALVAMNDPKVTMEIARHYKILQSEKLDVNVSNKPIDDTTTARLLKDIGDSLT